MTVSTSPERVAVVTGGTRGIGRAIAAGLVGRGDQVVISGRSAESTRAAAASLDEVTGLDQAGRSVRGVAADSSTEEGASEAVRAAVEQFGRVDVLVNNVGGGVRGDSGVFGGEATAFGAAIDLMLTSAYLASRAAAPHMRDAGWGRIVNIGSGASRHAAASPGYTAAKHGLVGLTRQLAQDLGRHGITVNCVCPGWTDTDLVDFDRIGRARGISAADARSGAEAEAALGRVLQPSELVPLVLLLCSPDGGSITGQVIGADGGFRL